MHIYFLKESLVELTKSIPFFQTDFFSTEFTELSNNHWYEIIFNWPEFFKEIRLVVLRLNIKQSSIKNNLSEEIDIKLNTS